MKKWIMLTALLPIHTLAATPGQDAAPRAAPKAPGVAAQAAPRARGSIDGVWRMVSFRYGSGGALQKVQAGRVMLKHITPGRFVWVDYVAKTKNVTRMAGGTFTLRGGAYQETVEYGSGEDIQDLLGQGQIFHDTITARLWHHQGRLSTGLSIEENWERLQ